MTDSVVQKSIALIFLIGLGYLFKSKFADSASTAAIRNFILNLALPATIFLSVVEIDTQLDLLVLPSFALGINLLLMLIGLLLARLCLKQANPAKRRAFILLFPSLAPGLTVYPFLEQFLGRQSLAWAALADMGNKLFVLVGLYALAMVWFQRSRRSDSDDMPKFQWQKIGQFLLTEPVNIAIAVGIGLAVLHIPLQTFPVAFADVLQKIALCSTPMILFYVGISLKPKSFQLGKILLILLAKAAAGFGLSAVAIALLRPDTLEQTLLFVALPQASFSLWPLLHATKINEQAALSLSASASAPSLSSPAPADSTAPAPDSPPDSPPVRRTEASPAFFDTAFAMSLLAVSFPFSIGVQLLIFSNSPFFARSDHLLGVGMLIGIGTLMLYPMQNWMARRKQQHQPVEPTQLLTTVPDWHEDLEAEQLRSLNALIHKVLSELLHPNAMALRFQYRVQDRTLMVIWQHQGKFLDHLEPYLEFLAFEATRLNIEFLDRIRFHLQIAGEKKPYATYSVVLHPLPSKVHYPRPSRTHHALTML